MSDVVKDSLSIMSRIRKGFEDEDLRAMLSGLITVNRKPLCRKLLIVMVEGKCVF